MDKVDGQHDTYTYNTIDSQPYDSEPVDDKRKEWHVSLGYKLFAAAILAFGSAALVASLMHLHIDFGVGTGVAITQHAVFV